MSTLDATTTTSNNNDFAMSLDGIVFDCDGVLVDVTESYSATIIQTVKYVLDVLGVEGDVNHTIIDEFKSTGGFNDEIDLTYAAILGIVAANKMSFDVDKYMRKVISNADSTAGMRSVEHYLSNVDGMQDVIKQLDYPDGRANSMVYRTFNELFYGPVLYKEVFGVESSRTNPGLIDSDVVIVNNSVMDALRNKFGSKISMVTGRGYAPAQYTLKHIMNEYFDVSCCKFLEDMPRKYAKPNPLPLTEAINCMRCEKVLYVGDSVEDMLMARGVDSALFCGIASKGTSRYDLFIKGGSTMVLDSVLELPKMLSSKPDVK